GHLRRMAHPLRPEAVHLLAGRAEREVRVGQGEDAHGFLPLRCDAMPTHCMSRTILALALLGAAAAQDAGQPPAWRQLETQSPYLRAHAVHPVEWWPWSEAAFARAKE